MKTQAHRDMPPSLSGRDIRADNSIASMAREEEEKRNRRREKAKMRAYIRFLAWPAAACLAALWVVHNAQLRRRPFDSAL